MGLGFASIFVGADHVPEILVHQPIGLEGFDTQLTDAMRRKQKSLDDIALLPAGDGFLLAEFGGASQEEADARAHGLIAAIGELVSARLYTPAEAPRIWRIRETGLGATAFVPGKGTRLGGVGGRGG